MHGSGSAVAAVRAPLRARRQPRGRQYAHRPNPTQHATPPGPLVPTSHPHRRRPRPRRIAATTTPQAERDALSKKLSAATKRAGDAAAEAAAARAESANSRLLADASEAESRRLLAKLQRTMAAADAAHQGLNR